MPSLFVIHGRDQGMRFELSPEQGVYGIGREVDNKIHLHDTEVSRRHAELRYDQAHYVITDLGSSNGTFINAQRITSAHKLVTGDTIQIGRTTLLFTYPGSADAPAENEARIDIVGNQRAADNSRIVRTMRPEESSEIFAFDADRAQNPRLARARSNLQIMYRTALAISHTLDIDQLLDRIMELIFEWVESDRGCIVLIDPETQQLRPTARRNRQGLPANDKITISQTILDYVIERKEGVLTSNASEDDRWDTGASILQMGIREAICVPMQGRYNMVGVIYIDTYTAASHVVPSGTGTNTFTDEHLKLMVAIGHQAALAIEDTNYYSAMVQSERLAAVGQTIAMLSHHIKNILQGLGGGSYLVEMGLDRHDEAAIRKGWEIVEKNQKKISTLVMDMLTFSKEREPELSNGQVNQVVADVVELMQSRAAEFEIQLDLKIDASIPELIFDSEGIHRAVLNIVTNAIDACNEVEQGCITVSTRLIPASGMVEIEIADNGPGIPEEDQKSIFQLFSSNKGSRGTGLGLPVSQKILKEHGGQILIASELGLGTRFTLQFPAVYPSNDRPVKETMLPT